MTERENDGRAIIEGGHIVIRVAIDTLPILVDVATNGNFKVTDANTFAQELVRALNDEEEDGTTRIHLAFDASIEFAIEQGAEGVEEHESQAP